MRLISLSGLFLLGFVGCGGCNRGGNEPPIRYVSRSADAVLELRDLSFFARAQQTAPSLAGSVVTEPQLRALRDELERTLGFDPTSAEGLARAGLPANGPVALQIAGGGESTLWIVPVNDPAKFGPVLDQLIKSRATVDEVNTESVGKHSLTFYRASFGPEKVVSAVSAQHQKLAFIGFGPDAQSLVATALELPADQSITTHPEYQAQIKTLGDKWELRLISASGAQALTGALKTAGRSITALGQVSGNPELERLKSAGWALNFEDRSATVRARLRLDDAGLARAKSVLTAKGEGGPGLYAVDLPLTVLYAELAGDPQALLDIVAAPGTPGRERLSNDLAKIKAELGIDLEAELLPLLSGHGTFSLGLGDLRSVQFRELAGNPLSKIWMVFGVGATDPKALQKMEQKLDPGLTSRNLEVKTRQLKETAVRIVAMAGQGPDAAPLVESFALERALVMTNEALISEAVIDTKTGKSALQGRGGLHLELRLGRLAAQLSNLDTNSVPLLYRGFLGRILEALRLLDKVTLSAALAEDGVELVGKLTVAPKAQ